VFSKQIYDDDDDDDDLTQQKRTFTNQKKCTTHKINTTRSPAIAEGPRDAGVPVEIW